jgi:hypothetical protein
VALREWTKRNAASAFIIPSEIFSARRVRRERKSQARSALLLGCRKRLEQDKRMPLGSLVTPSILRIWILTGWPQCRRTKPRAVAAGYRWRSDIDVESSVPVLKF